MSKNADLMRPEANLLHRQNMKQKLSQLVYSIHDTYPDWSPGRIALAVQEYLDLAIPPSSSVVRKWLYDKYGAEAVNNTAFVVDVRGTPRMRTAADAAPEAAIVLYDPPPMLTEMDQRGNPAEIHLMSLKPSARAAASVALNHLAIHFYHAPANPGAWSDPSVPWHELDYETVARMRHYLFHEAGLGGKTPPLYYHHLLRVAKQNYLLGYSDRRLWDRIEDGLKSEGGFSTPIPPIAVADWHRMFDLADCPMRLAQLVLLFPTGFRAAQVAKLKVSDLRLAKNAVMAPQI